MDELDPTIYTEIQRLCALADSLAMRSRYSAALMEYDRAWKLIPEPKNKWEASTWILAAIGDAYFLSGKYVLAQDALRDAITCPDGLGNPFLHLRLGQVAFEKGELDRAADELMRAYMGDGAEIFAKEESIWRF